MKIAKLSINGVRQASFDSDYNSEGKGAFESFRLHEGKVFLLEEHFDRLKKSLDALGMPWDDKRHRYYSWISELCEELPKDKDAFVRFSVESVNQDASIIIQVGYIPFFQPNSYKAAVIKNAELKKPEYFSRTGFRIKSVDYVKERADIRQSAHIREDIEGILLTPDGYIAEAQTANIIWVKDGNLYTPPLDTGILAGTIRAYLMKNNHIQERLIKVPELESADEIILTSGASYLRPLSKINNIEKPGKKGPVFQKLYKRLVIDITRDSAAIRLR